MKKIYQLSIFVALFTYSTVSYSKDSFSEEKQSLWIFGGLGGGYSGLQTDLHANRNASGVPIEPFEIGKQGYQLDARGLLSYYHPRFVLDGGMGWLYNWMRGEENGVKETVTTKSLFAEASARYRFNEKWSLGPVFDVAFGTDTNFGSTSTSHNIANFIGLQADYELPSFREWLKIRIVGKSVIDINIADRNVYMAELGLQFGLPVWTKSESKVEEAPAPKLHQVPIPQPAPILQKDPKPAPQPTKPVLKIVLDKELIYFDSGSNQLSGPSQKFIAQLGAFLSANPDAWDSLAINGHTDAIGSAAYNEKLSTARAAKVKKVLVDSGVPNEKLTSQGFGFSQPSVEGNDPSALAKNRRVELVFSGVKNPELIQNKIRELKKS